MARCGCGGWGLGGVRGCGYLCSIVGANELTLAVTLRRSTYMRSSCASRLACPADESKEGLVVYLPRGFNNIMDNIPFEDGESLGRGA